jgi:hypothetical protein
MTKDALRGAGRPPIEKEPRTPRTVGITDEVFTGLKFLGRGSASQAISDLYRAHMAAKKKADDDEL